MSMRTMSRFRLGAVRKQKNGLRAKCVAYRYFNDIDIEYEDGYFLKNQKWDTFNKGLLKHPSCTITNTIRKHSKKRIGKQFPTKRGDIGTCIAYRGAEDIDIQFLDGSVREHVTWEAFSKGKIMSDADKTKLGVEVTKHNGDVLRCVGYRNALDVDVMFVDTGEIAEHKTWSNFIHGEIRRPGGKIVRDGMRNKGERVGVETRAVNGQMMKCIAYRSAKEIDVEFEDGTIVKNKGWSSFMMGNIANPNFDIGKQNAHRRSGTESVSISGQKMKCIAYRTCIDIDVQFEDGYTIYGTSWKAFENGTLRNPNVPVSFMNDADNIGLVHPREKRYNAFTAEKYIGVKRSMRDGREAEIVDYINDNNVTIRFESGEEKKTTLSKFMNGKASDIPREGRVSIARCGMKMTLIKYNGCDDCTVQFEDGTIREHILFRNFINGNVAKDDSKRKARILAQEERNAKKDNSDEE